MLCVILPNTIWTEIHSFSARLESREPRTAGVNEAHSMNDIHSVSLCISPYSQKYYVWYPHADLMTIIYLLLAPSSSTGDLKIHTLQHIHNHLWVGEPEKISASVEKDTRGAGGQNGSRGAKETIKFHSWRFWVIPGRRMYMRIGNRLDFTTVKWLKVFCETVVWRRKCVSNGKKPYFGMWIILSSKRKCN